MAELLKTQIGQWRLASNGQNATNTLLSKLTIGGNLYNIKDPAVEQLAELVDTRLGALESKEWDAVTKGNSEPKFATNVSQGTDGSITVTYGDAQTTDVKRTATNADSTHIALTGTTTEAALIELAAAILAEQNARSQGDSDIIGASTDLSTANTIHGAKKYADEKVNELAGTDWSDAAKTVKDIIDELSTGGNADFTTVVDKIRGDFTSTNNGTTTTDIKTYIDNAIAGVESEQTDSLSHLTATESDSGTNVTVSVAQQNGLITGVTVTESNIAQADDFATGTPIKNWEYQYNSTNEQLTMTYTTPTVYIPAS